MMQQFRPLITGKMPFDHTPDINKPSRFRPNPPMAKATWLKPKLVCEVSYAEITSDGVMRHPSFEGMRIDKNAKDIQLEKEKHTEEIVKQLPTSKKNAANKIKMKKQTVNDQDQTTKKDLTAKLLKGAAKAQRKTLLNPTEKSQTKTINGHNITFNNLNKIYYPAIKGQGAVTKRDVINYYYKVAPFMLPYMKDRPQTLIRYPNGI